MNNQPIKYDTLHNLNYPNMAQIRGGPLLIQGGHDKKYEKNCLFPNQLEKNLFVSDFHMKKIVCFLKVNEKNCLL